jgi:hypothetical protein
MKGYYSFVVQMFGLRRKPTLTSGLSLFQDIQCILNYHKDSPTCSVPALAYSRSSDWLERKFNQHDSISHTSHQIIQTTSHLQSAYTVHPKQRTALRATVERSYTKLLRSPVFIQR